MLKKILKNDFYLFFMLRLGAIISGAVTVSIFSFLLFQIIPLFKEVSFFSFFTDSRWTPTEGQYNFVPMLIGTLWAMVGAVLIATPLGVAVAVFHLFYAPKSLAKISRVLIWILAGIPSVVYGFWGLTRIVPLILSYRPPGVSLLAGILILSLMILPTVVLTSEAAMAAVPRSYLEGGEALGLDQWAIIRSIVFPAAKRGMLAGVLLEMARAIGETMAVIMVMGNTVQIPGGLFDSARTLTANIAIEMAYAVGNHQRALFFSGFTLLVMTTGLFMVANKVHQERSRH